MGSDSYSETTLDASVWLHERSYLGAPILLFFSYQLRCGNPNLGTLLVTSNSIPKALSLKICPRHMASMIRFPSNSSLFHGGVTWNWSFGLVVWGVELALVQLTILNFP